MNDAPPGAARHVRELITDVDSALSATELCERRPMRGMWERVLLPKATAQPRGVNLRKASAWSDGAGLLVVSTIERRPREADATCSWPTWQFLPEDGPCWHLVVTENGTRCARGRARRAVMDFGIGVLGVQPRHGEVERHFWAACWGEVAG